MTNQLPIKVLIPSYNNEVYVTENVMSALDQDYDNFEVLYLNDASTDKTPELLGNITDPKLKIISQPKRIGNVGQIYNAVHNHTNKEDICIILDGDDLFPHDQVLNRVNEEYQNINTWMTYGSYETNTGGKGCSEPIPQSVIVANSHRRSQWRASHLRTFKSWLFREIKRKDLMYNNGWFNTAGDLAITFPLLEMAAQHASFIPDVLYLYNDDTGQNDHILRRKKQIAMEMIIRRMPPYHPIKPFMNDTYLHENSPW